MKHGMTADQLYYNGMILTMDRASPMAEAVVVKDGRIAAVGTEETVKPWVGIETERIDLKGKTMMPGFIEPHMHPLLYCNEVIRAANIRSFPLGEVKNIAQIKEILRKKAKETPEGDWVLGFRYDEQELEEKRHPNRYDLDEVSLSHPVFIGHRSGHIAACNSMALKLAGIDKNTPDPPGGIYHRSGDGQEPDGVLERFAAVMRVMDCIRPLTVDERAEMMQEICRQMVSQGITSCHEALVGHQDASDFIVLQRAREKGYLTVRMYMMGWFDKMLGADLETPSFVTGLGDEWLKLGAVKLILDGSVPGFTGWVTKPYYTPYDGKAGFTGGSAMDLDDFKKAVWTAQKNHIQIAVHAGGDAAIDFCLDTMEEAMRAYPWDRARHRIEHCHTIRPDQLERMKRLGISASFFVYHTYYWGDRYYETVLGPERAAMVDPVRTAIEKGVVYSLHSDAPHVPVRPLNDIWAAVNRLSARGRKLGEAECITPEQALRGVTVNAAWQSYEEGIKGSIEVGKLADFVVLDENPLTCSPEKIRDIQVLETIIGGNTVYRL